MNFFLYTLIILLIPIPFKLHVYYKNGELIIKIFKFKKSINKNKDIDHTTEKEHKKKLNFTNYDYADVIKRFDKNPIKFKIKTTLEIDYGLEDAANTAVLYGVLWSLYPFIDRLLKIIFNFKALNFKLNPHYNEKTFQLDYNLFTIFNILILLFNIVYIIIIFKKSYKVVNG